MVASVIIDLLNVIISILFGMVGVMAKWCNYDVGAPPIGQALQDDE